MALMHVYCLCCSARLSTLCITVITLVSYLDIFLHCCVPVSLFLLQIHGLTSMLLSAISLKNLEQSSTLLRKIFNDLKINGTIIETLIERRSI